MKSVPVDSISKKKWFVPFCGVLLLILLSSCSQTDTDGWPTYRHDPQRSSITAVSVNPPLSLDWVHKPMHTPRPAWMEPAEELPRMHTDNAHHVAVDGERVYFGSPVDHQIYAVYWRTDTSVGAFSPEDRFDLRPRSGMAICTPVRTMASLLPRC